MEMRQHFDVHREHIGAGLDECLRVSSGSVIIRCTSSGTRATRFIDLPQADRW